MKWASSRAGNIAKIVKAASVFWKLGPIYSLSFIMPNIIAAALEFNRRSRCSLRKTWVMIVVQREKLNASHQGCLRRILRARCADCVTSDKLLNRSGSGSLSALFAEQGLPLAIHVLWMSEPRIPREAIRWTPALHTEADIWKWLPISGHFRRRNLAFC